MTTERIPKAEAKRPDEMRRRQALQMIAAMVSTFAVMRTLMAIHPTSNLNVVGYNVHHLFTGLLLLVASAIPLALDLGKSRTRLALNLLFGAGLGLTLDEWIYLVATDGSDMAYLTPVSFWGGTLCIAAAALFIMLLASRRGN